VSRSIIHLNIADFAAAVEINQQPSFRGYPLIIVPIGAPRAVVYDMSEEAYKQGIRKGMPLARVRRLNKKIKILPPSFNRYELVMKDLLKESFTFSPLIESGKSDGHIFMDVTGSSRLFGPSVDIAFRLKNAFKKTFNLDPVWSVATNKLIAKVATRVVKPIGEYIVAPGDEKAFLAPLPLHLIPGLIKSDLTRLREFNLFSISQARALTMEQLEIPCHNRASLIHDYIRGVDTAPVTASCEDFSSIYADHEFSEDTNSAALLKQALYFMVEKICKNLRDRKLTGAAAKIIISYSDGMQKSSKLKITPSTYNDMIMFKKCSLLLDKAWTRRVRIRHMRLVCEKLSAPQFQADLFAYNTKKNRQADLVAAMDRIRAKFGRVSIKTGLAMMVSESRQVITE
jgi:DNA polymerase-4